VVREAIFGRGGSPQLSCGPKCRTAFWSALRRWGERAIAAGILSAANIRSGDPEACTLLREAGSYATVGGEESREPVRAHSARRRQSPCAPAGFRAADGAGHRGAAALTRRGTPTDNLLSYPDHFGSAVGLD
jgi:hypothetical protein